MRIILAAASLAPAAQTRRLSSGAGSKRCRISGGSTANRIRVPAPATSFFSLILRFLSVPRSRWRPRKSTTMSAAMSASIAPRLARSGVLPITGVITKALAPI